MANLERIYTIPFGDAYMRVRNKRAKRAVAFAKAFALRHMKATGVKMSEGVNGLIFRDGMQKPPRRIKVRIVKGDDGMAKIWLIGEEEKLKASLDKKKAEEEAKKKGAKTIGICDTSSDPTLVDYSIPGNSERENFCLPFFIRKFSILTTRLFLFKLRLVSQPLWSALKYT